MEWLQSNWLWIALGVGFVALHFLLHGGHGGHNRDSGTGLCNPKTSNDATTISSAEQTPASRAETRVANLKTPALGGMQNHEASLPYGTFWTSRAFVVALAFLAIAMLLLLSEHRAHFLGALPLLLLVAACPLLHVFLHGNHTSHSDKPQNVNRDKS